MVISPELIPVPELDEFEAAQLNLPPQMNLPPRVNVPPQAPQAPQAPRVPDMQELLLHIRNLTNTQQNLVQTITQMKAKADDPFMQFKTPDPIKNLATFSGNKKETQAWIEDTQNTLDLFNAYKGTPTYEQIIRAIKNKIINEAKEILIAAGNPNTWEEIKEVLLNAYGDRRDLTSHIQSLFYIKQGNKSLAEYFNKIKGIDTAIKATASAIEDYKDSTRAINKLISLITLTRFVDGLGDQLSMHVRSYRPETLEEAYNITMQYSNAVFRQKLDRKSASQEQDFQKDKRQLAKQTFQAKSHNAYQNYQNVPTPPPQHSKPYPNQSGNFKPRPAKLQTDEDVSMRTARSRAQINAHVGGEPEPDELEPDTTPSGDISAFGSDDDDYFVGEELNFLQGLKEEPET